MESKNHLNPCIFMANVAGHVLVGLMCSNVRLTRVCFSCLTPHVEQAYVLVQVFMFMFMFMFMANVAFLLNKSFL